jgi:hypothetical protein
MKAGTLDPGLKGQLAITITTRPKVLRAAGLAEHSFH